MRLTSLEWKSKANYHVEAQLLIITKKALWLQQKGKKKKKGNSDFYLKVHFTMKSGKLQVLSFCEFFDSTLMMTQSDKYRLCTAASNF